MSKITIEYVRDQFANRGWTALADKYVNSQTKISAICGNGHATTITWNNFQRGQGCRFCAGNIKFSYDQVKTVFEDNGCVLLEKEYTSNNTPMKFLCSCGVKDVISLTSIKAGARCNQCTARKIAESNRVTDEELKKRCETKKFKFIRSFVNKDNDRTYIEYVCHCGNMSKTGLFNFNKIENCRICGNNKKSGKNCYKWNADRAEVRNRKIIRKRLGNIINRCLFKQNGQKSANTERLLKYHPNILKEKIMQQVKELGLENKAWHVDHIFPVQAFIDHKIYDLSLINHIDNLRALSEEDNLKKYDNYDKDKFLNWVISKTKFETIEEFLASYNVSFTNENLIITKDIAICFVNIIKTNQDNNEQRNKMMVDKHTVVIFSDEWTTRNKQVKNFLKSLLHINKQKIDARKCDVKIIDNDLGRNFCEEYHIQGSNNLAYQFFGLYHAEELVGVLSLGRHTRQRDDLVLDRLCFKDDVTVRGGASKLFKYAAIWAKNKNHNKIISFSDKRWSKGVVYEKLEFVKEATLYPDYSYVSSAHPHFRLTKQSQKKKTVNCPESMTEKEYARSKGLKLIYDCGKDRWVYNIK
jgi:hypothetical protein